MIIKRNLYSQSDLEERLFGRRNTAKSKKGPKKKKSRSSRVSETKVTSPKTGGSPALYPPAPRPSTPPPKPSIAPRASSISVPEPTPSAVKHVTPKPLPRPDYSVNNSMSSNAKKATREIGEALGKGAKATGRGVVKTGKAVAKGLGTTGKVAVGLTAGAILYNQLKNGSDD